MVVLLASRLITIQLNVKLFCVLLICNIRLLAITDFSRPIDVAESTIGRLDAALVAAKTNPPVCLIYGVA
jgi:hypothetical protein